MSYNNIIICAVSIRQYIIIETVICARAKRDFNELHYMFIYKYNIVFTPEKRIFIVSRDHPAGIAV